MPCRTICVQASEGRTTILVAHRLSTVRKADVIHCLSQGRLIESGSHDELMAREGLYYNLVTSHTEVKRRIISCERAHVDVLIYACARARMRACAWACV